jgi:spermidine/putrescine-binding protein
MTKHTTATKGLRHRSRRRFLKGSAAAGALLAAPAILKVSPRQARAAENTVRIIGPDVVAVEDWSDFERETGLTIEWSAIASDPGVFMQEVIANAAGDDYDIFCFDGGTEDRLGPDGYIVPIDESAMKRWGGVADNVKRSPLLQGKDGTQYGVPLVFNADSFAFFPDKVGQEEPLSYNLLFESEQTMGKVALEDTWLTTFAMAGMYLKHHGMATIDQPSNMTPGEAKATADFLVERKKAGQFRALWGTWEESIDLMANGEVLVENCWEPAVKALQRQGHNVRYAYTVEGYNKWMLAAYIPSQAKDRGDLPKIYKAIDGFLGGAYGAQIAVLRGYATGNPRMALDFARDSKWPAEKIEAIEANIAKIDKKFTAEQFWQNASPDNVEAVEAEWQRFVQA